MTTPAERDSAARESLGVPTPTMAAGQALYGPTRAPQSGNGLWRCGAPHGSMEVCPRCLATARAQGRAVVAEILDADAHLAIDSGTPARTLHVGRLACEALAAGLDVGLSGQDAWLRVTGWQAAKMHGIPLHEYPHPNRWQLSAGPFGMMLAGGVVIQGGQ
jgi:hypothetical protein